MDGNPKGQHQKARERMDRADARRKLIQMTQRLGSRKPTPEELERMANLRAAANQK